MYDLIYGKSYFKKVRKFLEKHPEVLSQYEKTLTLLVMNPFHPSLRTHSIGKAYSVSINLSYRIIIDFYIEDNAIVLLNIGNHDDVYGKKAT
jgi:toxin HigB-1